MRVLQIINSLNTGGAEKLLLDALPRYNEKGIIMDLLVLDGTSYPFLKALRKQNNCKVYSLSEGSVYNPMHILKLTKYMKQYDVIHAHLFPTLYWVAIAKLFTSRKNVLVYTEHNTSNKRRNKMLFRFLDKIVYQQFDKLVTISEEVDNNLKKHLSFNYTKFQLISNGVDLDAINNSRPYSKVELGVTENQYILIQVASFTPQKDQNTLIKSLQHIKSPVKVFFVGKGDTLNASKELVDKLGLTEKIDFLGIRMDVPNLLRSANIVVLSTHYEGLSLSSIEGLASGKPFVASNAPGLASIVEGAGLLFPIGDEKTLAAKIDALLTDQNRYNIVAEKCMKRASQYSLDKMITSHLKLYQTLCLRKN